MPSSSFIVNSEFQPMSYQELLHPVLTQTQYQRELDEKYTQLDLQADKLEQLANSAVDQASYERYKSFANRLREEAGNLARYGLRGRDNARFMELFRSYGKEIQPLLDAQTKRERLIAMQQQLSMQDPTSLYDRSAGNISLEELMANPSAAPVRQSGDLLMKQAGAMAQNLQNELRQATFSKTATPGYLAFTQKYGLSSADVAAFVSNPNSPNANKVLRAIYDQVMTSSGVKENWEGDAYNRAAQYVGMGLWNAIGKSAVQPLTDQWALQQDAQAHAAEMQRNAQRFQASQAAANRKFQREMMAYQAGLAGQIKGNTPVTPIANMSDKEQKQNDANVNKLVKAGMIAKTRDGRYIPTKEGMLAAYAYKYGKSQNLPGGSLLTEKQKSQLHNPWAFQSTTGLMKEYTGLNKMMYQYMTAADPTFNYGSKGRFKYNLNNGLSTNKHVGEFHNSFNKLIQDRMSGYDLYRTTSYAIDLGSSKGKEFINKATSGKDEINVLYNDGKSKSIKVSDLRGKDTTTEGRVVVDPRGQGSAYIEADYNGRAVKIPVTRTTVGESAYKNVINLAKSLDEYGTAKTKGYKLDFTDTGEVKGVSKNMYNLEDIEDRYIYNMHINYLDQLKEKLGQSMYNWDVTGNTKTQEIEYLPEPEQYIDVNLGE